ncbi:MAG TPA: glycosyltransferase [Xanthobacteraceae bacterium]|nr:glycosyltransferase [Xanthobacteraceae bacterium]
MIDLIALAALAVWIYLIAARGDFWLAAERGAYAPAPPAWPEVIAVIPARDEAEGVGDTIGSLLRQNYPGTFSVVLVDDQSTDGTAEIARHAAASAQAADRLAVISGAALPSGWTGKLWAMQQGVLQATPRSPVYILFTDADIVYRPDALAQLVAQAEAKQLVLTSWMVKLRCEDVIERAFIPAFIFFFQMLYPFAWVNRRDAATAAAAGGCMLVRAETLSAAGGIESIRDALIDDCALANNLKRHGPIQLTLTEEARSRRAYSEFEDVRQMVSRSAYAQLRYSPVLLAGTIAGMLLTYIAPVLLTLFADGFAQAAGLTAWAIMAVSFIPTLRFYRLSTAWAPLLPAIALGYVAFTLDSAYQHSQGRGGFWKGRAQANLYGG